MTDVRASGVVRNPRRPLVEPQRVLDLASVEDDGYGEEPRVVWEVEPGNANFAWVRER